MNFSTRKKNKQIINTVSKIIKDKQSTNENNKMKRYSKIQCNAAIRFDKVTIKRQG